MTFESQLEDQLMDDITEEIKWIEDEFSVLFRAKKCSTFEVKQAIRMLDVLSEKVKCHDVEYLEWLFEESLKKLEKNYPEIFNKELFINYQ